MERKVIGTVWRTLQSYEAFYGQTPGGEDEEVHRGELLKGVKEQRRSP